MIKVVDKHFSLSQICESGQCFRMKDHGAGVFSVIADNRYLTLYQDGDEVSFDCSEEEYKAFWFDYFDLGRDYGGYIASVNPNDSYLKEAVEKGYGIRILKQDLWEMIVTFLISQQNNIKRIRKCIDLICRAYGEECISKDGISYYAFPKPEVLADLEDDALMACNLGYRSKYVVRTAKAVAQGEIDLKAIKSMPYKKAREELLKCFGVGVKVSDCICLFSLHHLDAFPVDTHIRQVLDAHYKRGFPNRRYKGYRGVMQQYIFYYELSAAGK